MDRIVSLHWDNIDPRVAEAQRAAFAHFGLANRPKRAHGNETQQRHAKTLRVCSHVHACGGTRTGEFPNG
jgi:hypothetical protein